MNVERARAALVAAMLGVLVALVGCSGSDDDRPATDPGSTPSPAGPVEFDQALADELVAMQAADQEGSGLHEDRQARLAEIFDEHGWPGHDLVGEEGSTAAWVIAQHSDLDLAFQERALELLSEAVDADNASAGDLAYLTDRVAVAKGEPQTYGTQIRCDRKKPVPPTPIADPDAVDELRAEAGLEPMRAYLREMKKICKQV
ncbi:DUF6624 domain-containing protein [Nocardioides sp.]|uniref:DUF6624 domain-containing protein n=1 Tax=Nocardioides sp. TaxID=35761 RepID=UPI002ED149F8